MTAVPRVGEIACGEPILAEQNIETYDSVPKMWHADFTLACHGDSMEPRVKDGDVVAVRRTPVVENGEIAAVRIDDEATLKHVYSYPDRLVLQPESRLSADRAGRRGDQPRRDRRQAVGLCRNL
ncbi:MAG: LexA family protein [Acutalibacteraceae bacterium]